MIKKSYWSNKIVNITKLDNEYYVTCTFIVEKLFESAFLELQDRKDLLGVIYGEFSDTDSVDISLARVSHILENIQIKHLTTFIEVKVNIRTINTLHGKRLKEMISDGIPIVAKLRYIDNPHIKIFTIDIDLEQNVIKSSEQRRTERQMKIDKIEKKNSNNINNKYLKRLSNFGNSMGYADYLAENLENTIKYNRFVKIFCNIF